MVQTSPRAIIIAGPNGAGKTTFAREFLPFEAQCPIFVNADLIAAGLSPFAPEVAAIKASGGDEVDVVLPYRALMDGQAAECASFLQQVRQASRPLALKVIIESGVLVSPEQIALATRLALAAGADFVKTSTGKTPISATLDAATVMLHEIAAYGAPAAGFKASGGIRTVEQAKLYLDLAAANLGVQALTPSRMRFGASGLLNDIEAVLAGEAPAPTASGY